MHKLLLNRLSIRLALKPRAAFLIKSGDKGRAMTQPNRPDIQALRTRIAGEETVFIPGSSLKGVFRSSFERYLRGVDVTLACDPLDQQRDKPCNRNQEKGESTADIYKRQCLACRTFGSQQLGGRVKFADALPLTDTSRERANKVEERSGVSIDRKTGGPARGKLFAMEVVTGGRFSTLIQAENLQLWQLALLGTLIDDLRHGELRIGSATTRGLGAFHAEMDSLTFWQRGGEAPSGVAALGAPPEYGWLQDGALRPGITAKAEHCRRRGGHSWTWAGEDGFAVLAAFEEAGWPQLEAHTQRTA